jgi:DNA-directed RNA polymerase specialized sigma24 family protein
MQYRSKELTSHFKNFQGGDTDALTAILAAERNRLFDYIMRMSGQLVRSAEIADESIGVLENDCDQVDSLDELLIYLYKTARNFARDIWNADTSKLENNAYQAGGSKEQNLAVKVEHQLRALPPLQREAVILRERLGFALDEVAEIMMTPPSDIELAFAQGLSSIENGMLEHAQKVPELILNLRPFNRPTHERPDTQNLSLIMNDFRKTNALAASRWRMVWFLALLLGGLLAWIYKLEILDILGKLNGSN